MEDKDKDKISVHFTAWDIFLYYTCSVYFLTENNLLGLLGKISLALIFIVAPILFLLSAIKKFNSLDKYVKMTFDAGRALLSLSIVLTFVMIIFA
ncbi:hypothetical protein [Ligilactobacillus ceti]|uniref:hypothetical protein n=1 Tax=Ligilactobacillus ceti TaxID=395085 RepID=UPI000480A7A4|nr:hypothetical protein [Ligilactobacillus ceti]